MKKPYLVAIGNACFDEYYSADCWAEEGGKLVVHPMEKKAGGMIPNAASVMAGYGDHTYLLDYMNSGSSNQELKRNLEGYGLDTSYIVTDDRLPDAKCIIILTPAERTILVLDYPRPPRTVPEETMELLRGASYIYTTMTELRRFEDFEALADDWRAHGAKLVFDVETATFENSSDGLFSKASVLFFNEAGLAKYAGGNDPYGCIQALLEQGCEAVVITLGADGCDCYMPGQRVRLPGIQVQVADTTGAGDTFNASFLHCLLADSGLEEAARFANAAAARSTTQLGPKGGVASVQTVKEFMSHHHQERN